MASFWQGLKYILLKKERRVILLQSRKGITFRSLELRRWGHIVSLGSDRDSMNLDSVSSPSDEKLAFHTNNFEFALITSDLNSRMTRISSSLSEIPVKPKTLGTKEQMLEAWDLETASSPSLSIQQNPSSQEGLNSPQAPLLDRVKSITLNVTQVCNLQCLYCAAGGDGTYGAPQKRIDVEKTLPLLARALKNMNAGEEFHVSFLGGEPLLFPEGIRIICEEVQRRASEKGFKSRFKVTTNGTILNDPILDLFREFDIEVVVSCDGPDFIQNQRRPGKSGSPSAARVEQNLRRLQKEQGLRFGLHAVFDSSHTRVLTTLNYFEQFDPSWMEFTYSVNKNDTNGIEAYLDELYQSAQYLYEKGGLNELRKIISFKEIFHYLDRKQGIKNHCGIGKSFVVVDAKNEIYPCPWMVENKKYLIEGSSGSESLFLVDELSKNLTDLHQCESCWAKNLCGGGCHFIHKQDSGGKSSSFCERMRGTAMIALYFYGSDSAAKSAEITMN